MVTIRDRVVRNIVCLAASATCDDAARVMSEHGIGSVGVRREGKLVGLVTERELVAQMAAGADPSRTTLGEAMRAQVPAVSADATDAECAQLMRSRRTRHLAVKEGGEIVGVISMLDLVDLVVEEKQWSIDQLESYIRGGRASQLSEPIVTMFHHERMAG
ncbi:CBS domain-containing protein [Anaeromyxobacter oryzae]|uniref:Inosine-5-monophosphate dehydrogenase n=1 Tax=Anaeromyxobacter oryzae TaxID=2918170 RepID=A0ABM7WPF9_9BACT|nr:CBS domain-containing protein [Anaeromyxobacter oryzae]BDG01355.1 inosine-5-monophosphate dehydrogenase [Anaeromyxobacter oryzae]